MLSEYLIWFLVLICLTLPMNFMELSRKMLNPTLKLLCIVLLLYKIAILFISKYFSKKKRKLVENQKEMTKKRKLSENTKKG